MNGPSGLVVKVLTQILRDMGLSPTWFQFFSVKSKQVFERKRFILINECHVMMQLADMKDHKEKATVRFASAGRDSRLYKPGESVEPSSLSFSGQSGAESFLKHHKKVLSKCLSKAKYTDQPQRVQKGPSESKESESVLTVQDHVWKIETLWALKPASENFSFRASDGISQLCRRMFPVSTIVQHITMSRTKVSYMISRGPGPYFLQRQLMTF